MSAARKARKPRAKRPPTGVRVIGFAASMGEGGARRWLGPNGVDSAEPWRWTSRAALESAAVRYELVHRIRPRLQEWRADRQCQERNESLGLIGGCALHEEDHPVIPNRRLERAKRAHDAAAAKAEKAAKRQAEREAAALRAVEKREAAAKLKALQKQNREAAKREPAPRAKRAKGATMRTVRGSKGDDRGAAAVPKATPRTDAKGLPPGAQLLMDGQIPSPWVAALRPRDSMQVLGDSALDVGGLWLSGGLAFVDAQGKARWAAEGKMWVAAVAAYPQGAFAKGTPQALTGGDALKMRRAIIDAQNAVRAVGSKGGASPAWPVAIASTQDRQTGDGSWRTLILAPLRGGPTRWGIDAAAAAILAAPARPPSALQIMVIRKLNCAAFLDAGGRVCALLALRKV